MTDNMEVTQESWLTRMTINYTLLNINDVPSRSAQTFQPDTAQVDLHRSSKDEQWILGVVVICGPRRLKSGALSETQRCDRMWYSHNHVSSLSDSWEWVRVLVESALDTANEVMK